MAKAVAHSDPTIAAIQTKFAAGQKSTSIPLHPPDTKALVAKVSFTDAAIQRKLDYASKHNITVSLTDVEMKSLIFDINRSS